MTVNLALELDGDRHGYGYVHVAGCRDLSDSEPLGAIHSLEDIGVIVAEVTGWECDDPYQYIAPCARKAFR